MLRKLQRGNFRCARRKFVDDFIEWGKEDDDSIGSLCDFIDNDTERSGCTDRAFYNRINNMNVGVHSLPNNFDVDIGSNEEFSYGFDGDDVSADSRHNFKDECDLSYSELKRIAQKEVVDMKVIEIHYKKICGLIGPTSQSLHYMRGPVICCRHGTGESNTLARRPNNGKLTKTVKMKRVNTKHMKPLEHYFLPKR